MSFNLLITELFKLDIEWRQISQNLEKERAWLRKKIKESWLDVTARYLLRYKMCTHDRITRVIINILTSESMKIMWVLAYPEANVKLTSSGTQPSW